MKLAKAAWIAVIVQLAGCQLPLKTDATSESRRLAEFSVPSGSEMGSDGCKSILDNYCGRLYSPEASGNLLIDQRLPIQILRGETSNQIRQVYVKYAQAKLRNRFKLPPDFQERLWQNAYFEKLENFIHRNPIPKMTLGERLNTERLEAELSFLWDSSIDQTIVMRMSRKYPGYHRIPERTMPIEYTIEERRTRRILISEISRAIWREDANWKKVEDDFRLLKVSFLDLFDRLDVSAELRDSWKKKIESVELVLPGSSPAIADEECSATNVNAYYYKYLNLITVCAGDFNSEDIVLTLAHEMSHALGVDRDLVTFLSNTVLNRKMVGLRENICDSRQQIRCDDWRSFKGSLSQDLLEIARFAPELPELNRCLKKTSSSKEMTEADVARIADSVATTRISSLASSNVFLRIIEKQVPMRSGRMQNNPNYMNPCGYYPWSSKKETPDDELYTLLFFTAEYQCSEGSKNERMKNAIEVAKRLSAGIMTAVVSREGEFSGRAEVVAEGFGSPPFERFADVVGAYAVAQYLKRYQEVAERRTKFLASSTWLCGEPSVETHFPELSKIEQEYSMTPHSQRDVRKMEVLAPPVRETLQCKMDFAFDECRLPLRAPSSSRAP